MRPLLRFEWDDAKEARNRKKHGVSFLEAMTVFTDEHALLIDEGPEGAIRIISARRANSRERGLYQKGWVG